MLTKRRTSKRFVLGDNDEDAASYDDETEVLPAELVQKFQMTLQTDADQGSDKEEERDTIDVNRRLLRPPQQTLQ
ncbi:unnamed protein product [Diatraea saccharalis]|uniref:Uncharacterized protein n=1 Tax=Diatraea saccharalis TaxID=40085 RepID=A0A9N9RDH3_9NEOP|nr:unnamed protein product [Diatraea saccharalis]